ncbi:MAG: signal peptide peptidase SppA, partial [Hyphomonas sp.]|nr:signal peptide peptidase SppA [Hyphomonas sp.]
LVDELGTFIDAIEKAKELAGIEADETPRLVYYPHRPTGLEALESLFGVSAEGAEAAISLNRLASDQHVQSLIEQLAAVEAMNSGQAQAAIPRIRER